MWMNGNNFYNEQYTFPNYTDSNNIYDLCPYIGKSVSDYSYISVPYSNSKILGFRIIKNPTDLPKNSIYAINNISIPSLPLTAI
jgi:hypothetical protein